MTWYVKSIVRRPDFHWSVTLINSFRQCSRYVVDRDIPKGELMTIIPLLAEREEHERMEATT